MDEHVKYVSQRLRHPCIENNIWTELSKIPRTPNTINLGQGFPNFNPIDHVPDALSKAPLESNMNNQYTRDFGKVDLVETLSKFYSPLFGRQIDPLTDILVTTGAYCALNIATQVFVDPGDEVIIIEPYFDCYAPMVKLAGGIAKFIPLVPRGDKSSTANWKLDFDRLDRLISKKTKAIILNNPGNPLGKVWRKEELETLSKIIIRHDILCISDEVYEHMVYEPLTHHRIGSFPGMTDRTITIGSAGKSWSVTGWKTGWVIGPETLIRPMQIFWVNTMGSGVTPVQTALNECFNFEMNRPAQCHATENPESYFRTLTEKELRPKREKMAEVLTRLDLQPIIPEGGYFMMADASAYRDRLAIAEIGDANEPWDMKFVRWLAQTKDIICLPVSAFQWKEENSSHVRFCFAKDNQTMDRFDNAVPKSAAPGK